jgi:KipI family sensor histidine kinase inhibitor
MSSPLNHAHDHGPEPVFRLAGDRGLLVEFGTSIDPDLNRRTRSVAACLECRAVPGIMEIVPAYASFMIIYQPDLVNVHTLQEAVHECLDPAGHVLKDGGKVVDIPVCYSQDFGPDLPFVAQCNNLTLEEVIRIHTSGRYLIYMFGFAPGFPYLGGLDPRLHTPRLDTPRDRVEAGSVGIANNQTGIYPIASPGGWQIIGRTPLRLFTPEQADPVPLYRPGDQLRFVPISETEFHRLAREENHA